jgi:hypothetical protein
MKLNCIPLLSGGSENVPDSRFTVFPYNLKDNARYSPFSARIIALIPVLKHKLGKFSKKRSAEERRFQIFHKVLAAIFEGFNSKHIEGVYWKDAESIIRFLKPFLALWLADGKERLTLTGFLKVHLSLSLGVSDFLRVSSVSLFVCACQCLCITVCLSARPAPVAVKILVMTLH